VSPTAGTASLVGCPACRAIGRQMVEFDIPDFRYGVPGLWSFARCTNCSLVYLTEPLPSSAAYPARYSQHRTPAAQALLPRRSFKSGVRGHFLREHGYDPPMDGALPAWLIQPLLKVPVVRILAGYGFLLFPEARSHGRLLDVGCGNGRFLKLMSTLGWDVHGIEPDPVSAEVARRFSGATVHRELSEASYPPESFDVITMNHVLEHMPNPEEVLTACHHLLQPGGQIGIAVPNWRSIGHRQFGQHWYSLDAPRHLIMWEPPTLIRSLRRAGFDLQRARTTSAREWAITWRESWRYRTGRYPSRVLTAAWGVLSATVTLVSRDSGEELLVLALKR
jgi:2-polyprenyl-3-methyl-5-hydroxy-6-metoxy-1,4-benzoquinol methylase